jgi:hypothetical protein
MECTASLETEPITTNSIHPSGQEALQVYIPEALYWKHYYDYPDINYEWNNGQLEVVPVVDYAKYMMYLWFIDVLRDFLHVQPIARIIGLEVGFRLALPTKVTSRKPTSIPFDCGASDTPDTRCKHRLRDRIRVVPSEIGCQGRRSSGHYRLNGLIEGAVKYL